MCCCHKKVKCKVLRFLTEIHLFNSDQHKTLVSLKVGSTNFNALVLLQKWKCPGHLSQPPSFLAHLQSRYPWASLSASGTSRSCMGLSLDCRKDDTPYQPSSCLPGWIVLMQVPLTRLEEFWFLATKSLSELTQNPYIVLFVDCLSMGDPVDVDDTLIFKKCNHHELSS